MALTDRARMFVLHFVGEANLNGTEAARLAHGFKNRTSAATQSTRYLKDPEVVAAIREAMQIRAAKLEYSAEDWFRDVLKIKDRCIAEGPNFDPMAALRALDLTARHLGVYKATKLDLGESLERLIAGSMPKPEEKGK